jgi:hypothetical protein
MLEEQIGHAIIGAAIKVHSAAFALKRFVLMGGRP